MTVSGFNRVLMLIDASGSTIGLVKPANVDAGKVTTYTYDPSGDPTVTGAGGYWPFMYQGMEKEPYDPAPYYYSGGGQFYSPQMVRSLSETGQTGTQGTGGGPAGNAVGGVSGGGFSPNFSQSGKETAEAYGVSVGIEGTNALLGALTYGELTIPYVGWVAAAATLLFELFDDLFNGGSDTPPTPRKLLHGRHPLYPDILGVSDGLIPDEGATPDSPDKPQFCGDPAPCPNARPLQKKEPTPEYRKPRSGSFTSSFSNCVANSIAGGALPCYVGICGAGIALFARGQKVVGGIAAGTGCGAAAATIFCCVGQGFGSDIECPTECPSNEPEQATGRYTSFVRSDLYNPHLFFRFQPLWEV